MLKKILAFGLFAVLVGGGIGYYMWNKPHEKMEDAKVDAQVTAAQLFSAFEADETAANAQYVGKVLEVSGKVKESKEAEGGTAQIVLETEGMFGVSCTLDPLTTHARTTFTEGESVKFKGTCTGYNLDVQLERCVEVK